MYELGDHDSIIFLFNFYRGFYFSKIWYKKMIEKMSSGQQFYQLQPTPQVLYKSFSKSQLIFSSFILLLPNELQTL